MILRTDRIDSTSSSGSWHWKKDLTKSLPRYDRILPREGGGPVEVSFGQQRLWFLAQLKLGSEAYNTPIAWRIEGPLNVFALEYSLNQLVARHESFRTTFSVIDGQLCQIINKPLPVSVSVTDLSMLGSSDRQAELKRLMRREARRPFDLAGGPVLRPALFHMARDEHVLLLTLHHIACDGPSMIIVFEDIAAFYQSFLNGTTATLPGLSVQYADFAIWQRALVPKIRDIQLSYWREQLCHCAAALDFPSEHLHSGRTTFRGEMEYRDLPADLSEEFRTLVQRRGITRFMGILALFQLLLARYTGQEDICVGCPMTHRTRAEISRVVGFFVNMVALRCRLKGNPTFGDFLHGVRDTVLGAYAHQDIPFEQLVAELHPERLPGRNPFFQAMLEVEETSWRQLKLSGTQCTLLPTHNGTSKFDLGLHVADDPQGFRLALEYNSDITDVEIIKGFLEHFENLLHEVVRNPDGRVLDLPLLTPTQRHELLVNWNDTRVDYAQADCAHRLFENQTEKTPDAVAVKFKNQQLTYQDLNSRANKLARYLVSRGARAEVLIAVCLERSLDLIVALLAIMKSGAAYLPLEPSHPRERREEILRNSGATILLTEGGVSGEAHVSDSCTMMSLADIDIDKESELNLPVFPKPSDLAYVMYTSGSTGQPKGVQVEHRNLGNLLMTMQERLEVSQRDVLLAVTTVIFDIAALELWLPFSVGASVVLAGRDEVTDAKRLMTMLERYKITVMQATPVTWRMLLAAGWEGDPQLKALCGGELLAGSLADELLSRCRLLWNMYGPTETTIWSSMHRVKPGEGPVVPIGQPVGNTRMYVLDANLEPVPTGVRGELFIGGDGVTRGYLGEPELTAERFVPDPFSSARNSRLYRTGDIVRRRPDGHIEFQGRNDRQIKLRGFRIEPTEIESVLTNHPAVSEAVVQLQEEPTGDKRLVAYIVPETEITAVTWQSSAAQRMQVPVPLNARCTNNPLSTRIKCDLVSQLRSYMQASLPEYMLPSAFVVVKALPLTSNGKIDRKALPFAEHTVPDTAPVLPQNDTERRLGKLWEEILGNQPIGVTDNFFQVGGDSLLATHLFVRIEKEFGKHLSVGTLFEAPTIRKLAAVLREDSWATTSLIQVQAGDPAVPPIFFIEARVGYAVLAKNLGPDQSVYVVSYDDLFAANTELSLPAMAKELADRIRRHHPHGPYYLGGMCGAARVAFAVSRELCRQGEEVPLLVVIDIFAPGYRPASPGFVGKLRWQINYALQANRKYKLDWLSGMMRALDWQVRNRSWQLARLFFRRIGRPLPKSLRHPTWLMVEAAKKDGPSTYPGRIALFRSAERTMTGENCLDLGWSEIATGGVDVYQVPGLHHALLRKNAPEISRGLKESLARTRQAAHSLN